MIPYPEIWKGRADERDEFLEECGGREEFRKILREAVKDFPGRIHLVMDGELSKDRKE